MEITLDLSLGLWSSYIISSRTNGNEPESNNAFMSNKYTVINRTKHIFFMQSLKPHVLPKVKCLLHQ